MKQRPYLSKTASLLDSTDWSKTPLGPRETWPATLNGYASMIMSMTTPAIVFWGPELTQIYNDGYAEIMGPRHPAYFGGTYKDCWPDTYPLIYPWMRRVLDHAEIVELERELIPLTRLGFVEDAYFTFTFTPLRDDAGRIAGVLQPVFEVTATVLVERRAAVLRKLSMLRDRKSLWSDAAQVLTEARDDLAEAIICEMDPQGRITVLAVTSTEQFGPMRTRELAALIAEGLGLEHADQRGQGMARTLVLPFAVTGAQAARRVMVVRTNPRLPLDDAYQQFMEMVAAELSAAAERADAAFAEERQHEYLDRLFKQAPAGIAVLRGPSHIFELINPMYSALIGHRDVKGRSINEALPELSDQPFKNILDRVYQTGEPHVGLSEPVRLSRTPGAEPEEGFVNYVYQPLHDRGHRVEGILVFCYEVTEQVLARQRSERLAEALRQEHVRKDEFLAMLAHELRNPLAPVKSAADLLRRSPDRPGVVERASQIIFRQVGHLSGLIDDLLDVSRVTRGLVALDRQPQDLGAVLLDAVEQVRPLADTRSHRLLLDLPPQHRFVSGDHKRLVQIFANLLNNAAKYTPDGGQICLRLQVDGDEATTIVEDTGIGIDADLLPRVFDLFVQGERGAARAAGGLGIGLALARSLVEMHGGSIAATSRGEGQGSAFHVTLPLLPTGLERSAPAVGDPASLPGKGQAVLVVDDNVDAAHMLALQLQEAGYRPDVRHAGRQALQACLERDYLACIVDIGLPDIDGMQVARHLKAASATPPLLVAVSGYGQAADVAQALEAGFDHYFVKPVDIGPLGQVLHDRSIALA